MLGVLNEHLEYLSLPGRSKLYKQALKATVKEGDLVADLGCGVGVLGLFALEAGAGEVWGIDKSDAIHLAREVVERSGLSDRYHCIADSTFRADLPEKVDLLLCDHVGFFGFDYGIIELLRDARRRFLKPGGRIMPEALQFVVAGVSSDLRQAEISAWKQDIVPSHYHWLDSLFRNARHDCGFSPEELMSAGSILGRVTLGEDGPDMFKFTTTLVAERSCRFDGLVGWFDCELGGGVSMTNSPLDGDSIQRSQAWLPIEDPFEVQAGEEIGVTIRFLADRSLIAWNVKPPRGAAVQKQSTWAGTILPPADLVRKSSKPVTLSQLGQARAFVLSLVDGQRSASDIVNSVIAEMPNLLPSEQAISDYVHRILAQDGEV